MLQLTRKKNEGARLYRNGKLIGSVVVECAAMGRFTFEVNGYKINSEPVGFHIGAYLGITTPEGETFRIETWNESGKDQVGLGIDAPEGVKIWRNEIDPHTKEKAS